MFFSLTIIHIIGRVMTLHLSLCDLPLLCTPYDSIKIKNEPALLVVHTPQIELLIEEEREGGE